MQHMTGNRARAGRTLERPARFKRIHPHGSGSAQLLHGCPVMSAGGVHVGEVDHLMVDATTQQLRYLMLLDTGGTMIAIPWQWVYFDPSLARLVFYTLD
jgi:hypothetical protein